MQSSWSGMSLEKINHKWLLMYMKIANHLSWSPILHFFWLTCCSFGRDGPKKTFCQVHDVPLLRQALAPPLPGFGMWHAELRRLDKTTSYTCPDFGGRARCVPYCKCSKNRATGMQWFRHCNIDGKTRCTWRVCVLQAHANNAGVGQRQNNILVLRSRIRIHSLGEKLPEDVRS